MIKLRRSQLYEIVDGRQLFGGEVATHSVPQLLRQLQPLLLAHFLTPRDPPYGQVNINLPASLPSKPRPVFESLPLFSPTGLKGRGPTKQVRATRYPLNPRALPWARLGRPFRACEYEQVGFP